MSDPWTLQGGGSRSHSPAKDDWEDWEDEEVLSPITAGDGPLLGESTEQPARQSLRRIPSLGPRQSLRGVRRLTSRRRQKEQNAKVGITLVTDMTKFQQQQQQHHIPHQLGPIPENRESRTGKFVDAAALKALEGATPDDSIGTFARLMRRPTKGKRIERLIAESSPQADLSPSARPIMIGFEMPQDHNVVISPQTAVVETPLDFPIYFKPPTVASPNQPTSAWSPDTEDGASPRARGSTGFAGLTERAYAPTLPSIPSHPRDSAASPFTVGDEEENPFSAPTEKRKNYRDTATTPIYVSDDDHFPMPKDKRNPRNIATTAIYVSDEDDMDTPVTLFEEDGSPATALRKSLKVKTRQRSGTAASARSQGWWDQVTSPFGPPTPATPRTAGPSESQSEENQQWWNDIDKKKALSPVLPKPQAESSAGPRSTPKPQQRPPMIVVEDMSTPSSSSWNPASTTSQTSTRPEKPRIPPAEEMRTPGELPPPYSPPSQKHNVRYRAVFPPGHQLNNMYPPSPGPVPPGLSHTMTSQGGISLSDVPLTPPPVRQMPLPDRTLGSFVPGDHFQNVSGHGPRQKAERRRRRHEKEDVAAFKTNRGCFSRCGCFSYFMRPGREGRKRRRWCLWINIAVLVLTALGTVLGVLLPRRTTTEVDVPSRWLNLTDFPPMPTGVSTIIGPESDATTACVQPPTLWTCSLPKEQAESAAPFSADQPSFVLQIQFDNNTQQLWNVTGQEPPRPTPSGSGVVVALPSLSPPTNQTTTASSTATATPTPSQNPRPRALPARSGTAGVRSLLRRMVKGRADEDSSSLSVRSDPAPPSFQEMFFLGNTTDGVASPDKAGEPTPFYISILRSINDTVGPNLLTRSDDGSGINGNLTGGTALVNASDIAPPPALDSDGTGAPAVLLAFPTQQPLRLYDRGLPTERYAFYSYYNKTTYVKSVEPLGRAGDASTRPVPADLNGGSLKTEAKFLVTWLSVRYKVEIWTRRENSTRLVGGGGGTESNSTQPGSFPYPVTVTLDTHGGEQGKKFVFVRGVDDRQHIRLDDAKFVLNAMNTTGDLVNPSGQFNPSFGGMDGGTGGCQCQYTNFVGVTGRV